MSIASRSGKLYVSADDDSTRWTRREDLLTADVFGAFRYLAPELGILRFAAEATNADGRTLRDWSEERGTDWSRLLDIQMQFWPKLAGREPDLMLGLGSRPGTSELLILVEAKLHAVQHRIDGLSQLGFYGLALNAGGLEEPEWDTEAPALRPLIFLTKGSVPPTSELLESRSELGSYYHDGVSDVFWSSWEAIRRIGAEALMELVAVDARPHVLALLEDLLADLEERGFTAPRERRYFPLPPVPPLGLDAACMDWLREPSTAKRAGPTFHDLANLDLPSAASALSRWRVR